MFAAALGHLALDCPLDPENFMFRLDDLMVSVLPSSGGAKEDCEDATAGTGNTVCGDSSTSGCISPGPDTEPAPEAWRNAQFARLSMELERALAD